MSKVLTLALKDLRLLSRDWFGLFWILVFPLMFALFFGAIFSGSPTRAMPIAVVDEANTQASRDFVERLKKSPALEIKSPAALSREEAQQAVRKGNLVAYVLVKPGFQDSGAFFTATPGALELGIDPSRRAEVEYLKGILTESSFAGFKDLVGEPEKRRDVLDKARKDIEASGDIPKEQKEILRKFFGDLEQFLDRVKMPEADKKAAAGFGGMMPLEIKDVSREERARPRSSFEITFPSSILWGILGCVAGFSISIVTERVQGTFLRLRTAPLTRHQLLGGKGLACFLACIFVTVFLLTLARAVLQVRLGNVPLLIVAAVCTAIGFTGLMMFVSTLGKTETGVAGAGWGLMMPMAMLGGGMVPLIAMPPWMQTASHISPMKWGILALEGATWRDFTIQEMLLPCGILLAVGAVFYGIGVWLLSRQES